MPETGSERPLLPDIVDVAAANPAAGRAVDAVALLNALAADIPAEYSA